MRYIIADTETTGLGPTRKAVEIAIREITEDLETVAEWESLIDPEIPIHPDAQAIHGISAEMVANEPTIEEFVQYRMGGQLDGEICVIGHNVQFDLPMLHPIGNLTHSVCTLELARAYIQGPVNFKLDTLREFFGIPMVGVAHRAMADVNTTHEILKRIAPISGRTLEKHALTEARVIHVMPFGKHQGKALFDLPSGYVSWLLALPDLETNLRTSLETARLLK